MLAGEEPDLVDSALELAGPPHTGDPGDFGTSSARAAWGWCGWPATSTWTATSRQILDQIRMLQRRTATVERLEDDLGVVVLLQVDDDQAQILPHWRTEQTTGRITRSRLDVFLTYWLTMRSRREFTSSALFKEFERWLRSAAVSTEDVFAELSRYAEIYDRIDQRPLHGVEGRFLYRMKVMQTSTPMPLLLFLYGLGDRVLSPQRRIRAIRAIDSYLIRRAILNLSNRDYNHVFRELVVIASQQPERADEAIINALAGVQGHHRQWPADAQFRTALEQDPLYSRLYRHRVRILLEALEDELRTDHTEQLTPPVGEHLGAKLTIEHVMPQSWRDNWPPLEDDPHEGADRDELVHTLGNLTLVTARLNPTSGTWRGRTSASG
ncbi:HNH endonuclease family protein [Streptomyces sp. NPDC005125]